MPSPQSLSPESLSPRISPLTSPLVPPPVPVLITFVLQSGTDITYQCYHESELRQCVGRCGFLEALFRGSYQRNIDESYDFRDHTVEAFNLAMEYVLRGKTPFLSNRTNMEDLKRTWLYLALPDEFLAQTTISVEELFNTNLSSEDANMIVHERYLRGVLFSNEEKDYRSEDSKYLLPLMFNKYIDEIPTTQVTRPSGLYSARSHPQIFHNGEYYLLKTYFRRHTRRLSIGQLLTTLEDGSAGFRQHIDVDNLFENFDFTDLVIAGGCVASFIQNSVGMVSTSTDGDIDLFIVTKDLERAKAAVSRVLIQVRTRYPDSIIIRSANAITIGGDSMTRPVQVILRLYNSIIHVISGFDVDSCCVAYDGEQFYCMPRYARAVSKGYNLVDPERQSQSYGLRLAKYINRGFYAAVPGYDPQRARMSSLQDMRATGLAKTIRQIRHGLPSRFRNQAQEGDSIVDSHDYAPMRLDSPKNVQRYLIDTAYRHLRANSPNDYTTSYFTRQGSFNREGSVSPIDYLIRNDVRLPLRVSYSADDIVNGSVTEDAIPSFMRRIRSSLPLELGFKTQNVGTQLTNSFNPTFEDWYRDLYLCIAD